MEKHDLGLSTDQVLLHGDAGLQPERTLLAWRRTILAMIVCACFFLRWVPAHLWLAFVPAALIIIAVAMTWLRLNSRYQAYASGLHAEHLLASVFGNLTLAVCVSCLCLFELAAILTNSN